MKAARRTFLLSLMVLLLSLLLVTRLELDGRESPYYDICLDHVHAGVGDVVLVLDEGGSARQVIGKRGLGPARAVIVGIVDEISLAP